MIHIIIRLQFQARSYVGFTCAFRLGYVSHTIERGRKHLIVHTADKDYMRAAAGHCHGTGQGLNRSCSLRYDRRCFRPFLSLNIINQTVSVHYGSFFFRSRSISAHKIETGACCRGLHYGDRLQPGFSGDIRQSFPCFTTRIFQAEEFAGRHTIRLPACHIYITVAPGSAHVVQGYRERRQGGCMQVSVLHGQHEYRFQATASVGSADADHTFRGSDAHAVGYSMREAPHYPPRTFIG